MTDTLKKLACVSRTGSNTHLVVDFDMSHSPLCVMTACGKLLIPDQLMDIFHHQISCERCRSVSKNYSHKIGYIQQKKDGE